MYEWDLLIAIIDLVKHRKLVAIESGADLENPGKIYVTIPTFL